MSATGTIAEATSVVTDTAISAWALVSDFLIVIVLFAAFFLFAWYIGRGALVALLLAFYSAYALYTVFPYMEFLPSEPGMNALLANAGVYFALVVAFYIILRRVIVSDFLYIGIFGLIILSFLGAAFLLALAHHTFSVSEVYTFTPTVAALFAPIKYFFWWFAAPAIGLFFLAR